MSTLFLLLKINQNNTTNIATKNQLSYFKNNENFVQTLEGEERGNNCEI